jgi:formate--tetrahydrofolate ligase
MSKAVLKKYLPPTEAIAKKLNLTENLYERRTPVTAKLSRNLLKQSLRGDRRGKLIPVTATSPTASGEGKTVTSIGLVQGLEKIGKSAIINCGAIFDLKVGRSKMIRSNQPCGNRS